MISEKNRVNPTPGVRKRRVYRINSSPVKQAKKGSILITRVILLFSITLIIISIIFSYMVYNTFDNIKQKGRDEGFQVSSSLVNGEEPSVNNVLRKNVSETNTLIQSFPGFENTSFTRITPIGWQSSHGTVSYAEVMLSLCNNDLEAQEHIAILNTDDNSVEKPAWNIQTVTNTGRLCNE